MVHGNSLLLPHEQLALIDALRRDLRIQQESAERPGPWADWHDYNARMVKRLLEALNPKCFAAQETMPGKVKMAYKTGARSYDLVG